MKLTRDELATALTRAAAAHHEYEARLGKRDENWAEWYADHIAADAWPGSRLTPAALRERADATEVRAREYAVGRSKAERDRARFLLTRSDLLRGIAAEMEDV